jgi:hypothetical protein
MAMVLRRSEGSWEVFTVKESHGKPGTLPRTLTTFDLCVILAPRLLFAFE